MKYRLILVILLLLMSKVWGQVGFWETIGEMPCPVSGAEAVAFDSVIYILGGYSDSLQANTDLIQAYYPEKNKWEIIGKLMEIRSGFIAEKYFDDIIIYGGLPENDTTSAVLQRITIKSDTIIFRSDTTIKENRLYSTGLIVGNTFYIIGGLPDYSNVIQMDSAYIFGYNLDEENTTFKLESLFPESNFPLQQMSAFFDNKIYVFGGSYLGVSSWIYRYMKFDSGIVRNGTDLIEPRAGGRAISDEENNIYIIGGYNESVAALKSVEKFNVWTEEIDTAPSLNYSRKEFMAVKYKGNIFVFGGKNSNDRVIKSIEKLTESATTTTDKAVRGLYGFELFNCYPNPFNPATNISFSLKNRSFITLQIVSILGEKVRTLKKEYIENGTYSVKWDGKDDMNNDVSSGIYFYTISDGNVSFTKKAMLIK